MATSPDYTDVLRRTRDGLMLRVPGGTQPPRGYELVEGTREPETNLLRPEFLLLKWWDPESKPAQAEDAVRAVDKGLSHAPDAICGFVSCQHYNERHTGEETARGRACTAPGCKCSGFVVLGECSRGHALESCTCGEVVQSLAAVNKTREVVKALRKGCEDIALAVVEGESSFVDSFTRAESLEKLGTKECRPPADLVRKLTEPPRGDIYGRECMVVYGRGAINAEGGSRLRFPDEMVERRLEFKELYDENSPGPPRLVVTGVTEKRALPEAPRTGIDFTGLMRHSSFLKLDVELEEALPGNGVFYGRVLGETVHVRVKRDGRLDGTPNFLGPVSSELVRSVRVVNEQRLRGASIVPNRLNLELAVEVDAPTLEQVERWKRQGLEGCEFLDRIGAVKSEAGRFEPRVTTRELMAIAKHEAFKMDKRERRALMEGRWDDVRTPDRRSYIAVDYGDPEPHCAVVAMEITPGGLRVRHVYGQRDSLNVTTMRDKGIVREAMKKQIAGHVENLRAQRERPGALCERISLYTSAIDNERTRYTGRDSRGGEWHVWLTADNRVLTFDAPSDNRFGECGVTGEYVKAEGVLSATVYGMPREEALCDKSLDQPCASAMPKDEPPPFRVGREEPELPAWFGEIDRMLEQKRADEKRARDLAEEFSFDVAHSSERAVISGDPKPKILTSHEELADKLHAFLLRKMRHERRASARQVERAPHAFKPGGEPVTPGQFAYHVANALREIGLAPCSLQEQRLREIVAMHYELATARAVPKQETGEFAADEVHKFLVERGASVNVKNPGLDATATTRAELVDLVARALGRYTRPLFTVGMDSGKAAPVSMVSLGSLAGSGAPSQSSQFPPVNAVPAFEYYAESKNEHVVWHTKLDRLGRYDAVRDEYRLDYKTLLDVIETSMRKVPVGRGVFFPLGSLQCHVNAQHNPMKQELALEVMSSRGMGHRCVIDLRLTRRAQLQSVIDFTLSHNMEPDEAGAMLYAVSAIVFMNENSAPARDDAARGQLPPYDEQSMIDLRVEAADMVERAQAKFWSVGGRMRTHENKQIEQLFTAARAAILNLDPERFMRKGS